MAGFFATVKAIRSASDDLLNAGKEFASKFKSGELSPDDYESTMIGKIHEIVNANSKGDTDLEKYLEATDAKFVTLVFPTSHINSPASMYGHTFLKISSIKDLAIKLI